MARPWWRASEPAAADASQCVERVRSRRGACAALEKFLLGDAEPLRGPPRRYCGSRSRRQVGCRGFRAVDAQPPEPPLAPAWSARRGGGLPSPLSGRRRRSDRQGDRRPPSQRPTAATPTGVDGVSGAHLLPEDACPCLAFDGLLRAALLPDAHPIAHRPRSDDLRARSTSAPHASRRRRACSRDQQKRRLFALSLKRMKGLEPSTFCMASRRSSQLSYIRGSAEYRSLAPRREPPNARTEPEDAAADWSSIRPGRRPTRPRGPRPPRAGAASVASDAGGGWAGRVVGAAGAARHAGAVVPAH